MFCLFLWETSDSAVLLHWEDVTKILSLISEAFVNEYNTDGSVRLSEAEYGSVLESYKDSLRTFGINPDVFADNFGQLVEGDVSPTEFKSRLNTVYSGIEQNIPEVKEYYATNFVELLIVNKQLMRSLVHISAQ